MSRKSKKKTQDSEAKGQGASKSTPLKSSETHARVQHEVKSRTGVDSFAIFDLCIQRARNLVKLHKAAHGKPGKPEKYTGDAHRAAIVLAVSALDAFVADFVIAQVRNLLANPARALPGQLADEIRRFLGPEVLLEAARKDDLMERVEKALRNDFDRRSFQGTRKIEEQLRMVGFENVFHEVAVQAQVNEDNLRGDLDRFTQRRHEIAHRGDYDLSKNPPIENMVRKKDAEDCIKIVCLIAKEIRNLGDRL